MHEHDVTASAAECAECHKLEARGADIAWVHLQAQKDAWWLIGQALGLNPLVELLNKDAWDAGELLFDALRVQTGVAK